MKILVTGGAGFIGSHIVEAYLKERHQVLIIDNLSSGKREHIPEKVDFENLDINDPKLTKVIEDYQPDIINHQAAQIEVRASVKDPAYDAQINILGSLRLLEAARNTKSVKKFVFASSGGAVYGDADIVPTDESYPTHPISPYGVAKLSVEHYLHYYHAVYGLPYIALRYANVYGPRQNPHGEAGVVAIFYQRSLSNQTFKINGTGAQTRDFVYVEDVARANALALNSNFVGPINIATGIETSVTDLVNKMAASLDIAGDIPHAPAKAGEQMRSCLAFDRARAELKWEPEISLDEGLGKTAEFFKK